MDPVSGEQRPYHRRGLASKTSASCSPTKKDVHTRTKFRVQRHFVYLKLGNIYDMKHLNRDDDLPSCVSKLRLHTFVNPDVRSCDQACASIASSRARKHSKCSMRRKQVLLGCCARSCLLQPIQAPQTIHNARSGVLLRGQIALVLTFSSGVTV